MIEYLELFNHFLWEKCLLVLLLGLGVYLTVRLKGMQLRYLPYSLRLAFFSQEKGGKGDISQFQSLMTALAATMGIGSIAGMATAVMAGGMGAIFWMWLVALFGMVTKFAEAILAVKYRQVDEKGEMCGGPMYYIHQGLGWPRLGAAFAVFGAICAFAGGNITQSHSIAHAIHHLTGIPQSITGVVIAFFTAIVILGGIRSLGKVNAVLVPAMALLYIGGGALVLLYFYPLILPSIQQIFLHAFTGQAAFGGFVGAGVMQAVQLGVSRGISSNEAGLGSAPIASAAAKTDVPGRQALISMTGVFISSFLVCTMTVLIIAVTGVMGSLDASGDALNGAPLVMEAFRTVLPFGHWIVGICIVLFGYSTILGWAYYGEKCVEYLFGVRVLLYYRIVFILLAFLGTLLSLDVVWVLVDLMNGLMALPNLIGLLFLCPVIFEEAQGFFQLLEQEKRQVEETNLS
ncbi:MAG: sodium:alanine symporter family protein [Chlamydiota bacterium]